MQAGHRTLEMPWLLSSCWWHSCFWRTDSPAAFLWAFSTENYRKGLMGFRLIPDLVTPITAMCAQDLAVGVGYRFRGTVPQELLLHFLSAV